MGDHDQEARNRSYGDRDTKKVDHKHSKWVIIERGDDDKICDSLSGESSAEDSSNSSASWSSSDLLEDASSSGSSSSSSLSNKGPLYELSSLMTHLPIKRGLSNFYQGKSQSFTSLASVKSLGDLAKKENPYRKRMKTCESYGGGLDGHNKAFGPKATIQKKSSTRGSFSSLLGQKHASMGSFLPPSIPLHKSF